MTTINQEKLLHSKLKEKHMGLNVVAFYVMIPFNDPPCSYFLLDFCYLSIHPN